jgi:hypothetical protein
LYRQQCAIKDSNAHYPTTTLGRRAAWPNQRYDAG